MVAETQPVRGDEIKGVEAAGTAETDERERIRFSPMAEAVLSGSESPLEPDTRVARPRRAGGKECGLGRPA